MQDGHFQFHMSERHFNYTNHLHVKKDELLGALFLFLLRSYCFLIALLAKTLEQKFSRSRGRKILNGKINLPHWEYLDINFRDPQPLEAHFHYKCFSDTSSPYGLESRRLFNST